MCVAATIQIKTGGASIVAVWMQPWLFTSHPVDTPRVREDIICSIDGLPNKVDVTYCNTE